MFTLNQKRFNIYAPYEAPDGTRYGNTTDPVLRAQLGIVEIPDPQPPADYSEDTYYRTEQDDAPYVVFTRKSDEQINQTKRARILAQIAALEQGALMARQVREVMLALPGADQQPWFARVKALNDEIAALRATLPPDTPTTQGSIP
jgi:hypothetical protein